MGGKAFDEYRLPDGSTPQVSRISPELYRRMVAELQPKLQELFRNVAVPREAPGKEDHGDIDFLVEGAIPSSRDEVLWDLIKTTLGATIHIDRNQSRSFGVPHPETPNTFVQIDVELSPGHDTPDALALFEWTRFMKSDGDLLQIIGIAHRSLGLTCNDRGLHVRVEEIESSDRKKALVFLTRDPLAALRFYGLDTATYAAGFSTPEALFAWVSSGRFFSLTRLQQQQQQQQEQGEKSKDRSRRLKRPLYRAFIETYIPHLCATTTTTTTTASETQSWTRERVLDEALAAFPAARPAYDARLASHAAEQAEQHLWTAIRARIPASDKTRKAAAKALRRWVAFEDGVPRIRERPLAVEECAGWAECVGEGKTGEVLEWVERNWEGVRARDRAWEGVQGNSHSG